MTPLRSSLFEFFKKENSSYDLPINLHLYKINEFGYFQAQKEGANNESVEIFIDYGLSKSLKELEIFYKNTPNLAERKKTINKEEIYLHHIEKIENNNICSYYIIRFALASGFSYKIGAYVDMNTGRMSLPDNKYSTDVAMKFSYLYIIPDKNILISFRIAGDITGKSSFEKYMNKFFKEYEKGGYVKKKEKQQPIPLEDLSSEIINQLNYEFKKKKMKFKISLEHFKNPSEEIIEDIYKNFEDIKKVTYQVTKRYLETTEKSINLEEERKLFYSMKEKNLMKKDEKIRLVEERLVDFENAPKEDFLNYLEEFIKLIRKENNSIKEDLIVEFDSTHKTIKLSEENVSSFSHEELNNNSTIGNTLILSEKFLDNLFKKKWEFFNKYI